MTAIPRPYVDKYGHRYTEAIFKNWHPRVIESLGIHKANRTKEDVLDDKGAKARARLRQS